MITKEDKTMRLLKATTIEGKTEYFNPNNILTMQPNESGTRVKILMGAGLFWWVHRNSIKMMDVSDNEFPNIFRGDLS